MISMKKKAPFELAAWNALSKFSKVMWFASFAMGITLIIGTLLCAFLHIIKASENMQALTIFLRIMPTLITPMSLLFTIHSQCEDNAIGYEKWSSYNWGWAKVWSNVELVASAATVAILVANIIICVISLRLHSPTVPSLVFTDMIAVFLCAILAMKASSWKDDYLLQNKAYHQLNLYYQNTKP